MIQTKAYHLTKSGYTKIFMRKYFERRKWTFILLFLLIMFYFNFKGLFKFDNIWGYILIGFPIFNALLIFILVRFNASGNLTELFLETNLSFVQTNLFIIKNDNEIKIPYKNIQKVEDAENHWLVYISKSSFIYVPKNIFYTTEEQEIFKTYINA